MDFCFSQEGMEETIVNNEECDIMDYLDEFQLSFLLQEAEAEPESEGNNMMIPTYFEESNNNNSSSSSTIIIPRNNSTTTLCTSIEPLPPVLICTEKRRPAANQPPKKTKRSPMILTFGNPTTTVIQETNGHQNVNNYNAGEEEEEVVLVSNDEAVAAAEVGKRGGKSLQKKRSTSCSAAAGGGRKRGQAHTYDHILAERKRRELLSQQFVALSTIVPGLKKMDKTSVLGDAINYLKHLQERVKIFEEKSTTQTMESLVILKKSQVYIEDEGSSDDMQGGGGGGGGGGSDEQSTLPEIEAKVSEKCILLKVLCHKNKGVLVNLLTEIEKLNLCVTSTNVTQFGTLALDITIVAEMEEEFDMTIKDLIIHLQAVVQRSNEGD